MRIWVLALLLASAALAQPDGTTTPPAPEAKPLATTPTTDVPAGQREFRPFIGEEWIGNGISYGPHRDGQIPGKTAGPTREQIREDLQIMSKHWKMLRVYAFGDDTELILQVIRELKLPMKVMLGAWISAETKVVDGGRIMEEYPDAPPGNLRQVENVCRLANEYADIVIAITVGNETQIFWSSHKVPTHELIRYIRMAREKCKVPIACADDYNFWNKPEGRFVARECDFIVSHAYAAWGGQPLDRAVPFTIEKHEEIAKLYPRHKVVLGEAGWATSKSEHGEQAKLIKGAMGENEQKTFYKQYLEWSTRERIPNFYFEAFDENWKGGQRPEEVEKHWGLFKADRTPKAAIKE